MRTLLTGFGPFGDVVDNPSARIATHFAASGVPGHELTVRILPVSFERASEEITRLLMEGGFDLAVMLGVAGRDSEIRVETCARNQDEARIPDCDGRQPSGCIAESGLEIYETTLDAGSLVKSLIESGIPARVSDSAGSYVCNRAYYAALHTVAARSMTTRCLFVHVPPHEESFVESTESFMSLGKQIAAVKIILRDLGTASKWESQS